METCYTDDCQKKEWMKLRQLRLQQVREQSKVIAQDVLRKSKEKQEEQRVLLRAKRANILQEWKTTKIQELEQKYNNAMAKVGLAIKEAHAEPDSEAVLNERKLINEEAANIRGKRAEQKHMESVREAREKENAPIRRKEMAREIEDIRSGLVVQCRDWNVINQTGRQVMFQVPVTNADDFQPTRPIEKLPFSSTSPGRKSSSARLNVSPKPVKKSVRMTPYTSPRRSPLVPTLDDLKSYRSEMPCSETQTTEEPLVEFYDHQARYSRNYRLGERLVQRTPEKQADVSTRREQLTPQRPTIPQLPEKSPVPGEDDELSLLLQKYSSQETQMNTEKSPEQKTPVKRIRKCLKTSALTPPTKENDFTLRKPNTRRSSISKPERPIKSTSSSTKKLLETIDKALEEGRKLRKEASIKMSPSPPSPSSSSSENISETDSDSEAIVKLVVNVNCGQHGSPEKEEKINEKSEKSCQVTSNKVTCDFGTEIGDSLAGNIENELPEITPIKKVNLKKTVKNDKCWCNKYGCCSKCSSKPMQRSSTFQNLAPKMVPETLGDMSSIYGDAQVHKVNKVSKKKTRSSRPDFRNLAPKNVAEGDKGKDAGIAVGLSVAYSDNRRLVGAMINKSNESINSRVSQSTWCPTSYFSPPGAGHVEDTKQEPSEAEPAFKFNPMLDFYIRKLLDLPPDPCESSQCTDCRCNSARSTTTQSTADNHDSENKEEQNDSGSGSPRVFPMFNSRNDESRSHSSPMVSDQTADETPSTDYEAETKRRLERIAYLKSELQKIRMDKHLLESSSTAGSSSDGSKSDSSKAANNEDQREMQDKSDEVDAGVPHHLSTIMEVESRILASSPDLSSSDKVQQLIRRGIITSPFRWSQGESLSDCSDNDNATHEPSLNFTNPVETEVGTSFNTLRPPLLDISRTNNQSLAQLQSFDQSSTFFHPIGPSNLPLLNLSRSTDRGLEASQHLNQSSISFLTIGQSNPPLLDFSRSTNQRLVPGQPSSSFLPIGRREESIDLGSPERDLERILSDLNVSKK